MPDMLDHYAAMNSRCRRARAIANIDRAMFWASAICIALALGVILSDAVDAGRAIAHPCQTEAC